MIRLRLLVATMLLITGSFAYRAYADADTMMAGVVPAAEDGRSTEIHSLLVHSRGSLRYEHYFRGNDDHIDFEGGVRRVSGAPVQWHKDRLHYVASVTKTVTALLTGMALDELGLDVHTRVADLLPAGAQGPDAEGLTLEHLLTMRAGFIWDEWAGNDLVRLWQSDDFARFLLARENTGPGTVWQYNSAGPNLLLAVLEAQLGQPLQGWADARFFAPLGIGKYRWEAQPTGTPEGSARLFLSSRDLLRIGQLMLGHGKLGGQQIIPEGWVEKMTTPHTQAGDNSYGYLVWLRSVEGRQAIVAEGDGGQYIWMFPEDDLIVVITQGNYLEWPLYRDQAMTLLTEFILPAFAKP